MGIINTIYIVLTVSLIVIGTISSGSQRNPQEHSEIKSPEETDIESLLFSNGIEEFEIVQNTFSWDIFIDCPLDQMIYIRESLKNIFHTKSLFIRIFNLSDQKITFLTGPREDNNFGGN